LAGLTEKGHLDDGLFQLFLRNGKLHLRPLNTVTLRSAIQCHVSEQYEYTALRQA